jgi:hypothetical protein
MRILPMARPTLHSKLRYARDNASLYERGNGRSQLRKQVRFDAIRSRVLLGIMHSRTPPSDTAPGSSGSLTEPALCREFHRPS